MALEPITLFTRIADPAGVARRLRELVPDVEVDGSDDNWRNAVVPFGTGKARRTLTFTHDPDYYSEPNWSSQMNGMRGYFSRFPETERKSFVLMLTTTFKFSLGTQFEPEFDPEGDPRLEVLFAVAELLDGVLFTPSALRDAGGRVLVGANGKQDEDAVWPRVIAAVSAEEPMGAAMHEKSRPGAVDDEENKLAAPTAERVARRALALTAVTARGILEQDAKSKKSQSTYKDLLTWVQDIKIDDEFGPDESEVLQCPLGRLEPRQQIVSTWRLEGLVVLAWALRKSEIPPHDQLVNMNPLWKNLGLFDAEAAAKLLASPVLRAREEIGTLRSRLFALHWRLRNFRLRPQVMDFADFAKTCWFGPLDLNGLPLVKGDLALNRKRLDKASADVFSSAHSAAHERHQAVNWLWEGPEDYSEASVAT